MQPDKDYLTWEDTRNRSNHGLYAEMLRECFGDSGILIAHHLCFNGSTDQPQEIPSADALIFDHEIMATLFGLKAISVMVECASVPADRRDAVLARHFYARQVVSA